MKYTNKKNLPPALVSAVTNDPYTKGDSDISTTTLIGPPRIACLMHDHDNDIEMDVSEAAFPLIGNNAHAILERVDTPCIKEQRYFWTNMELGWTLSGQVDIIENNTLSDYKVTSVYKAQKGMAHDWLAQLNVNAFLAKRQDIRVDAIQIIAILRDWSVRQARQNWTYPDEPIIVIPGDLWDEEITYAYIKERMNLHKIARASGILPECTDEERWMQPQVFRCMKKGNKMSSKNFPTREQAEEWIASGKDAEKYHVEEAPKTYNRCELYCLVNKWCDQYQKNPNGTV